MVRTLVVGPGWLGSALLDVVRATGEEAWGMRRSAPLSGDLRADVTAWSGDPDVAAPALPPGCPSSVDVVVLCVSPSRSRGDTHESTYPAAARGAVRLSALLGARTLLYVSSTGVYARDDGAIVDESTPVARTDDRLRALADAEDAIWHAAASHTFGRIVLRVAGLYGPGRDPAARFGDASGITDGSDYWTNFAWRDDVISAIRHLASLPMHHQGMHCYNCADGSPVLAGDIVRSLASGADTGTRAQPAAETTIGAASTPRTPRMRSNQRVSVDRLLETGWTPSVADVFRGLELLGHPVRRS